MDIEVLDVMPDRTSLPVFSTSTPLRFPSAAAMFVTSQAVDRPVTDVPQGDGRFDTASPVDDRFAPVP